MYRPTLNKSFHQSEEKATASANSNATYDNDNQFIGKSRLNNTVCGAPVIMSSTKFQRYYSIPETMPISAPLAPETLTKTEHSNGQKSFAKFLKFIRPHSGKKKSQVQLDASNVSTMTSPQQNVKTRGYRQNVNRRRDVIEYAASNSELKEPITVISNAVSIGRGDADIENALNENVDVVAAVLRADSDKLSCGRRICDSKVKDATAKLDSLKQYEEIVTQGVFSSGKLPIDANIYVIKCQPNEIQPKRSVLKNTIPLSMQFSSGCFRKSPVSLRQCCPRDALTVGIAGYAIERDYDILSKVKHSNLILLMATTSNQWKSLEYMTLVMEPVNYTLNYYLHQMDTQPSIVQSVSVVQQIASASLYLQQCGYIHSNISSHNVLIRENLWCVKLSSFELTTNVDFADIRAELMTDKLTSLCKRYDDTPKYAAVGDETNSLRDQYKRMSKLPSYSLNTQHKDVNVMSKHLVYDINYRQHLSLHNYQAPELLTTKSQFVFPTTKANVYSLCLLLWEMLNDCVPFVVYDKVVMERMIESKKLSLPFFEPEKCQPFMDIFRAGLALTPEGRTIDVERFVTTLDEIKRQIQSDIKALYLDHHVAFSDAGQVESIYVNMSAKEHIMDESLLTCSILSANSVDFNMHLHRSEVTSTKKKERKTPRKFLKKKTFRQLFMDSKGDNDASDLTHSQVNKQFDEIASKIRHEQSKDDCESKFNSIVAALSSEESEFSFKISVRDNTSNGNSESRKLSLAIDENRSASKHDSNSIDALTTKSRGQPFVSNIASPETDARPNVVQCLLSSTPTASKNRVRRNACLSNKLSKLSNKNISTESHDGSVRLNNSNNLKVNIRIVQKENPPKERVNSVVMSRIKFFDANANVYSNTFRTSTAKISKNPKSEDIDTNYAANYPVKDSSFKKLAELDEVARNDHQANNKHHHTSQFNCRTTRVTNEQDVDQRGISNEFKGSDKAVEHGKVKTSRWPSVRDRILQFEKPSSGLTTTKPPPPLTVATEFVKNMSKHINETQSKDARFTKVPTLIRRPVNNDFASCSNQKGLLCSTAEVTTNGSFDNRKKCTISDCTSITKISASEFENSQFESVADESFNVTNIPDHSLSSPVVNSQGTPRRRCFVRVKQVNQIAHSIEDLYIDDDFDQIFGLGANMELQSDSSDFVNFDINFIRNGKF